MSTESQQQIARKARDDIRCYFNKPYYAPKDDRDPVLISVLSAIERTHQNGRHEGRQYESEFGVKPQRSDQPNMKTAICPFCHGSFVVDAKHIMELQRSERQEWTAAVVLEISQLSIDGHAIAFREAYDRIADAHNAELAAERQRREQAEQQILNREQRWEEIEKLYDCGLAQQVQLREQLLSAQAAIAHALSLSLPVGLRGRLECFDLSLLHQHDADVRAEHDAKYVKPLVDALEKIRGVTTSSAIRQECDDALAKVKEGNAKS